MVAVSSINTDSVKQFFFTPILLYNNRACSLAIFTIQSAITLSKILLGVFSKIIGRQLPRIKQSTLPSFYKTNVIIDLPSYKQQPITKYILAISISQSTINSLQVFKALFKILFSPSTVQNIYALQYYKSYYTQQVCLNCLPNSLLQLIQQLVDKASYYLYIPNLLYKPILTAYPYLNRLIYIFVLLGYINSVINKVLILPLRQVYQELKPNKGVKFLKSSVAAIIYYTPQLLLAALYYL